MSSQEGKYSLIQAILIEVLLIAFGLILYYVFPFFQFYFNGPKKFGIYEAGFLIEYGLIYLALVYLLVLPILFHAMYKRGEKPKSLIVYHKLLSREFDKEFWYCIRTFVLKFIYIPLMFLGALAFGEITSKYIFEFGNLTTRSWRFADWVNNYVYPFYVNAVMTFVLIIYTFSYCIESELLGNKIKSVDDSWFSWLVTLACYLPLYPFITYVIPMAAQETSFFLNPEVTAGVHIFLIVIIGMKAWSIVSLGTKSTNLTNRGIVESGPYALIRHPHYVTKMMAKWILVLPVLVEHFWLIGGMIFWTTIYVLRSLTEEQHLRKDPDYVKYMDKVKWRFFPGIF